MFNYNHECPFEAFITNLGKYNEGELVGEWLKFPTTHEKLQEVMNRIGIGSEDEFGQPYEEWFITDYDIYTNGLSSSIMGEYANLDELNYLATRLTELSDHELEVFSSAVYLENINSIKDLINLTYDTDNYNLIRDIDNNYDLGYYYIEESGTYDTEKLGNLSSYIDYERFGRDLSLELDGIYVDGGFLERTDTRNCEMYDGISIPKKYQIISKTEELDFEHTNILEEQKYETVYGYVYENDTYEDKDCLLGSPENIANYIMANEGHKVVITDIQDRLLVSTMDGPGGFLDRVSDQQFRTDLLDYLMPLQFKEKEIGEIKYIKGFEDNDNVQELAARLTEFAMEENPYEFCDNETYPGETFDNTVSDLNKCNVKPYIDYLKQSILEGENTKLNQRASELIDRLEAYSDNYIEPIEHKHSFRMS